MEEEINIRLKGEGIRPGLIRSKEIAEILESVEDMVVAEAMRKNPELNKDNIIVGVYSIEDKSIGLRFKTTFASMVIPAFISAAEAIQNQDYRSLTSQTLNSLKIVSNFTKRHSCEAIIGSNKNAHLAVINSETVIPQPTYIKGQTEIVGRVIRVGGKAPKAMIELTDGSTLYCEVPEEIAKQLGHQLYSLARFEGYANWDAKTLELEKFKIYSVQNFPNNESDLIFGNLEKLIGAQFRDIVDMDAYVTSLRSDGDEE